MRILQLIQRPQLRGAEIFAAQLSRHLAELGHEVRLVSLFPGNAKLPYPGPQQHLDRPESQRLTDLSGWKRLADIIREFNPDIVQANAGDTLKYAVWSQLLFGWKVQIMYRNANKVSDFVRSPWQRLYYTFLARRADHVISVSELCRRDFVSLFKIPESRTTVVPIGVERGESTTEVPEDLIELFREGNVLVHAASFVREKNHAGLLRIAKRLTESGAKFKCLLIGDGRLRAPIERRIVEMNLQNFVKVLGPRSDVPALMAHASIVILPSLIEGLPAVIIEAMACGTPVVAYNVGGVSEAVRPGETGWLVPAGDEVGFVSAIREILTGDYSTITTRARQLVELEFDNKLIAKRFAEVYAKCVTRTPKSLT